jgi:hypothetical protein
MLHVWQHLLANVVVIAVFISVWNSFHGWIEHTTKIGRACSSARSVPQWRFR